MRLSRLLSCLAFAWLFVPAASAQDTAASLGFGRAKKNPVTPALLANTSVIAPGKPFLAAVQLKAAPPWHTYWENPGETGGASSIAWTLPEGFKAGPVQWPMPHAHLAEGFLTYVYEGEVLLLTEITPPPGLPPGEITLKAKVEWYVCKDQVGDDAGECVPGDAEVTLALKTGEAPVPNHTDLIKQWQSQLPKTNAPFPIAWDGANPKELKITVGELPKDAKIDFYPLPPEGAVPEHPRANPPGTDGKHTLVVPLAAPEKAGGVWRGLLMVKNTDSSPREGWLISADPLAASTNAAEAPPSAGSPTLAGKAPPPQTRTLWELLVAAFLGGLILNVMPCVLPVISLKIFGFVSQANSDPKRVARLGLAFVAGVFVFFLALAGVALWIGKSFVWGAQNSDPRFFTGIITIVFVFGLSMLGVFELTLSSAATSKMSDLSGKEGYGGAFVHGLFTTLLGTSCTAPYLALALGYASRQPSYVVLLLFVTMAAGLSLPYFLLTQKPVWLKYVPKPGVWMERFKQVMGFVMLAYAVFLYAGLVTSSVTSSDFTSGLLWFLLLVGFASWLYGILSPARPWVGIVAALAVAGLGYAFFLHTPLQAGQRAAGAPVTEGGVTWQPFSEEAVLGAVKEGKPVFVDFTAGWCANCKLLERTVLAREEIGKALLEKKVLTFKADWTWRDPKITAWLNKFDRIGIPLYVLYRPGEPEPLVQDWITVDGLVAELNKIPKP